VGGRGRGQRERDRVGEGRGEMTQTLYAHMNKRNNNNNNLKFFLNLKNKKEDLTICCLQEMHLTDRNKHCLRVKE
jgi:hypothetical protein